MTKKIGLTGGIGSGKSTIATYLNAKGIPVFIADIEAKKIMQNQAVLNQIKTVFGESIFENNILNRAALAQIVFSDTEKLALLNQIIHPAVQKEFEIWLLKHQEFPLIVYESAILFESGNYKFFDTIITVTAALETRIQRVIHRDNSTRDQVLERIKVQWSDEQRQEKSDFIITNDSLLAAQEEMDRILKILKN